MKKVEVIVKEKTLLELKSDAVSGDLIDLNELAEVDATFIEEAISEGKDKIYASKLAEVKKAIIAESNVKITELTATIETLRQENSSALKLKEKEVSEAFASQIANLQKQLEVLKSTKDSELEAMANKSLAEANEIRRIEAEKYSELEAKYNIIMAQYESQVKQVRLEIEAAFNARIAEMESARKLELAAKDSEIEKMKIAFEGEKNQALREQKEAFDEEIKNKNELINNLQRAKAAMNVKQTGEDLETWCDNEVTAYMQNGLFNCTWTKDNKVIKEGDEVKGSKADYIFKVYADEHHNENEILATVCLDMKDENPDSVNKKVNADYYKQLDKNREKKNCKYAVLVSNLEMDKPNVLPIYKVRGYEDMYVVRPAYLMTFLNMVASLTSRFADLVLSKEVKMIELKGKLELIDQFEEIKKTYLDKPLESLEKNIEAIYKNSESIKKASKNIDDSCDAIKRSYINQIIEKISKFELKLEKGIIKHLKEETKIISSVA